MIQLLFPTSVYIVDNLLTNDFLQKYQNTILNNTSESGGSNWLTNVKNCLGTYNLNENSFFEDLHQKVTEHVNVFNKHMGSNRFYSCKYSWFNIYEIGDYQEYHNHPHSTYSAIFFLKTNSESSPLVLQNPAEDMHPPHDIVHLNELNFGNYRFESRQNSLIIFRSYIKHMVPKHHDIEKRITIAFNY